MSTIARRVVGDVFVSASGLLILLMALVVFDDRFREQLSISLSGGGAADVGRQVNDVAIVVALVVAQFARQQIGEHTHLMIFTAASIVLVLFLMRL